MKYRSNTEIIDAILQSSEDVENTKTHIMYRSYLSFFQLKQYLELLEYRAASAIHLGSQLSSEEVQEVILAQILRHNQRPLQLLVLDYQQ